ncbi:alpha/beta fold hydrolase [Pseudonocardia asaccharolytica]|uniref:Alpha/beta hydrolase n=1 Tax=Pseudonocardia asaccharolytica DSM 44247 = NBRC 16224 TaxID=1123024 RepID=A0A511D4D3_9PSEU|nr:alpha/beta hydrolase [Pseudonocardia asaccharolytica]GEL17768.1 alpha/beta hydrolase [Pseudonocardia asaccharolytica DSM 44247 = NBRC 16224]
MTDYVLVHGGFCDGWYWGETATLLEKEGHRVHLADLPSTGRDPAALGGLADDAAAVRRLLDTAGEPVVLVGHSYGGMVLTEVSDHPAIAHTVYVSAFWPARGQSLADLFGPGSKWLELAPDGAAMKVTDDVEAARQALCADLDPARVPEWHASLMWSSTSAMGTPSTAPARTHPTTYVVLERDNALPPAAQEAMATRADRVERMATSHVPMLVGPQGLAAILIRLP